MLIFGYLLMVVFKVLVATGLLAIGGILVIEQRMNIGQFIAAEIIILLVMASVEKLILSLETIYDILTALEKIGQVSDLDLESVEGINIVDTCTGCGISVELKDAYFSFPDQQDDLLKDISLTLKPGEIATLTGENQSGKSTLLQVVAGLFDVKKGNIIYNGFPKGNIELTSLRSIIGHSLNQEQLFEGTILENITMGRDNASFENVQWAIESLGLTSFIKNMPEGLNTMIDPLGRKLSRSIRQKILLARSIVVKPQLLLLEDALEHIDDPERRRIIDFLTSKDNGWTMIAASSDPYLLEKSDKVILMHQGSIVKTGSYDKSNVIQNAN